MSYITVNTSLDTNVTNMNVYAVSFESTESNEAIQTFVFNHKDHTDHKYSVVQMSEHEGVYSCKLLQTYASVSASTPKNISDTSTLSVYIVTLFDAGTPSNALNQTMQTVTRLSTEQYIDMSSSYTSLTCAYSAKALYSEYTGPQMRIKRSSDLSELDWTFNTDGNSTEYVTWIGSDEAIIVTLYDQSGHGRDAIPTGDGSFEFVYENKSFVTTTDTYFSLPDNSMPIGNQSSTYITHIGNFGASDGGIFQNGTSIYDDGAFQPRGVLGMRLRDDPPRGTITEPGVELFSWGNDINHYGGPDNDFYNPDQVIAVTWNGDSSIMNMYRPGIDDPIIKEVLMNDPLNRTATHNKFGKALLKTYKGELYSLFVYNSVLSYNTIAYISQAIK